MKTAVPFGISSAQSLGEALACDIVCTCTVPSAPFLDVRDIGAGTFVASCEGRQAWLDESYTLFDKLCVDEWSSIVDGAHMKSLYERGIVDRSRLYAELKDVASGSKAGREGAGEKILLVTRGLGMEDIALANRVYQMAVDKGVGTAFSFL